jgi:hypothetical protein
MVYGLWLAVLGVLGASSIIIARKPDAKELIAKIAPYQGWIGAVSALFGVWGILQALLSLRLLGPFPIYWISWLATSGVQAALGFILGIGVFKNFIKDPAANRRMDQTLEKLLPYQGNLGLVAIGLGAWMVVSSLLWRVV